MLFSSTSGQLTSAFPQYSGRSPAHESPRALRLHSSDLRYEDQNRGQTGNSWKNWRAKHRMAGRSPIHQGNGSRTRRAEGRAGQERTTRATISSLAITTGPSLPSLSNPPASHLSRCYSHFSRLSATRAIPVTSLFMPIPVPVSTHFGLKLGPEVGSCSC